MKKRLLILCLVPVLLLAQAPTTNYPALKYDPATGNLVPSTTNGHAIGGSAASDTAFGSSWNAVTAIPPSKNAIYDFIHQFDTDDDGKVNVLDLAAGIPKTDASGVLSLASPGTDYVAPAGILAIAGFSSITGRIGNANLPLGPQLYDNAGTPVIAANFNLRKLYTSDGTEWLDFSDPDAGPTIPVSKGLKVGTFYIGGQDPSEGDSFIDPANQAATFGTVSAANRIYSGNETYYSSAATAHWSVQPWNTLYNGTNDVQLNLVFNRNIDSSRQDVSDYQIRLGLEGNYNNGAHHYIEYNFDTISPDQLHNRRWMYLKVIRDNSATPMTGDWQLWGDTFQLGDYLTSGDDTSTTWFSVSHTDATSTNLVLKSIPARSSKLYLNTTDSTGNPGSYATMVLQRAGVDKWSWTNQGANGDNLSVRNSSAEVYNVSQAGLLTLNSGLTVIGALTLPTGSVTDAMLASAVKPAVTLVATSNLTLSGAQTIDSVAGTTGQTIVLCTAQTTGSENGPWIMQTGAWTRPTWYTSGSTTQAPQFLTTFVRLGTTYSGSTWRMTTASVTIGTTATTWTQTPISLASGNVTGTLSGSSVSGGTFGAVNGSALTNITAANVTGSHTLPDSVLSTNVPLLNAASNAFVPSSTGNVVSYTTASPGTEAAYALFQNRARFGWNGGGSIIIDDNATNKNLVVTLNGATPFQVLATGVTIVKGLRSAVTTKTGNYTATLADNEIRVDCTSGAVTITLPAATGTGQVFRIKKIDSSGNAVTIARAGSDTIDGATSASLAAQYDKVTLVDGASAVWDKF